MSNFNNTIAIIPARGNSKGLPRKNMLPLKGKPLIAWTVEAARQSKYINKVVVTTEDQAIADIAKKFGAEVPFLRPSEYSNDSIHATVPCIHFLRQIMAAGYQAQNCIMLLPTSPLRRVEDIDKALELFFDNPGYNVVSVCELSRQLLHLREVVNGVLKPVVETANLNVQRQELTPLYCLNGSIYIAPVKRLLRTETFHVPRTIPYVMAKEHSVDINTLADLQKAETYLNYQHEETK